MPNSNSKPVSVSLFSGAGGMDVGFARAGFSTVLACEIDKDAVATYNLNRTQLCHQGDPVTPRSVTDIDFRPLRGQVDIVFGGPPCQGFSVAGKMDPNDTRSELIHSFFDAVDAIQPRGFVCENVKALATSGRWQQVRSQLLRRAGDSYDVALVVLNSSDFGVPQIRERMFLVGAHKSLVGPSRQTFEQDFLKELQLRKRNAPSVADVVRGLGRAGSSQNPATCLAKITYAKAPVLRRSPYAGMLFNGAGRPLSITGYAATLPASMGGNKTPIVDEDEIFAGSPSFIEAYHRELLAGSLPRSGNAPNRLRRLTVNECKAIQTFPSDYQFAGRKSSVYRQIGNAVPCNLAEAVAAAMRTILDSRQFAEATIKVA